MLITTGPIQVKEFEAQTAEDLNCERGIPRCLPISRDPSLPKFSEILSPALCERLKNSKLGGALVFDPSNF